MGFLKHRAFRRPNTTYKGLLNGCAPGVHEAIVSMVEANVPHRSGLIDFGAGAGALLSRFADRGFTDLHAADLGGESLQQSFPHTRVDLNRPFASKIGRRFKIVISTEVIEHLDSPRAFLMQIRQLMDDDGYAVISTPNIAFWEGRLKFLLTGKLWGFSERHYRSLRHISPMTAEQLNLLMREIGMKPIKFQTAGSFATLARWAILSPIWAPMRMILGPTTLGEAILFVCCGTDPESSLSISTQYQEVWAEAATTNHLPYTAIG